MTTILYHLAAWCYIAIGWITAAIHYGHLPMGWAFCILLLGMLNGALLGIRRNMESR